MLNQHTFKVIWESIKQTSDKLNADIWRMDTMFRMLLRNVFAFTFFFFFIFLGLRESKMLFFFSCADPFIMFVGIGSTFFFLFFVIVSFSLLFFFSVMILCVCHHVHWMPKDMAKVIIIYMFLLHFSSFFASFFL